MNKKINLLNKLKIFISILKMFKFNFKKFKKKIINNKKKLKIYKINLLKKILYKIKCNFKLIIWNHN